MGNIEVKKFKNWEDNILYFWLFVNDLITSLKVSQEVFFTNQKYIDYIINYIDLVF